MTLEQILDLISGTEVELEQGILLIHDNSESIILATDSDIEFLYTILNERLKNLEIPDRIEKRRIKRLGIFALIILQNLHSKRTPFNIDIAETLPIIQKL